MLTRLTTTFFALSTVSILALGAAGCAVDTSDATGDDADDVGTSAEELSAASARLVGAFHGNGSIRPPSFDGIVFKQDGTFFADLDTGIRCITAPCPSNVRLEGTFKATNTSLTLKPVSGPATGHYGKYSYTLSNRGRLALTKSGLGAWRNTLDKEISYCQEPQDCRGQNLITPRCLGQWACGQQNTCAWNCGVPQNDLWPSNATKLVAESAGGGFTPPPPPGSTCAIGKQKYTVDVATKKFAWEQCNWSQNGQPLHLETGTRFLTAAEFATVDAAMDALTVAQGTICGADKPFMTLQVSTRSSTKTLNDSFYSCMDPNKTYVDGIDGVFAAFRDLVR